MAVRSASKIIGRVLCFIPLAGLAAALCAGVLLSLKLGEQLGTEILLAILPRMVAAQACSLSAWCASGGGAWLGPEPFIPVFFAG